MTLSQREDEHARATAPLALSVWTRPDDSARGTLVWTENFDTLTVESEDLDSPESGLPSADRDEPFAPVHAEFESRRREAFESLDADLRTRRSEQMTSLERQRTESLERIARVERLESAAIEHRRDAVERAIRADEPQLIAERVDALLSEQLGAVKGRLAGLEARAQSDLEARRQDEMLRLERWRLGERERVESELAAEAQRFHDRLLRELQEFELQLAERLREQEERLARAWSTAEEQARRQLTALFDGVLGSAPTA